MSSGVNSQSLTDIWSRNSYHGTMYGNPKNFTIYLEHVKSKKSCYEIKKSNIEECCCWKWDSPQKRDLFTFVPWSPYYCRMKCIRQNSRTKWLFFNAEVFVTIVTRSLYSSSAAVRLRICANGSLCMRPYKLLWGTYVCIHILGIQLRGLHHRKDKSETKK